MVVVDLLLRSDRGTVLEYFVSLTYNEVTVSSTVGEACMVKSPLLLSQSIYSTVQYDSSYSHAAMFVCLQFAM